VPGGYTASVAAAAAANPGLQVFQAWLALARAETGGLADAAESYELLASPGFSALPLDSAWMLTVPACALVCARLEDRPRAARFGSAAAVHERIGAPTWLARTRLEWADMLVRRGGPGERKRARTLAARALETAVAMGLRSVERRSSSLLATAP